MSLNGLDNPAIKEAHETAVAEPGGWFLLKYTSRDEVDILGQGTGGIVDIRNVIAQYEEASPLYGFLRYRRRNVLLKYLPENCSRLLQARVAVHFNAVCERFEPYNTTFSIATAKELKDTKLSAACSLHTASSSTSSSTSSLRRRRLMEIAEEEEEEQRATKRQSIVDEEDSLSTPDGAPSMPAVTLNSELAHAPDASRFASTAEPPAFLGANRPPSPAKSLDAGRHSFQGSRSDAYSTYSSYPHSKPKVKLGPRPSLDTSGRPRTSGSAGGNARPVSSIPAGFKMSSKGSRKGRGADKGTPADLPLETPEESVTEVPASDTATVTGLSVVTAVPVPDIPKDSLDSLIRPHTSSGASVKSVATTATATAAKNNTMTPEKARLMKAMKLREKRKKMSIQPAALASASGDSAGALSPSLSDVDSLSLAATPVTDVFDEHSTPGSQADPDSHFAELLHGNENSTDTADSAIDIGTSSSSVLDHVSVHTRTDSHPASPVGMSSDIGDSTKASSFSESTDETTVPAHGDDAEKGYTPAIDSQSAQNSMPTPTMKTERAVHLDVAPAEEAAEASSEPPVPPVSINVENVAGESVDLDSNTEPTASGAAAGEDKKAQVHNNTPSPSSANENETETEPEIEKPIDAKRAKRRALVGPICTDLGPDLDKDTHRPDASLSDDEDLMEELQSAMVQEAMHMTVSKSPVNPAFPSLSPSKQRPGSSAGHSIRTVSNPLRGPLLTPADATASSARSVSSGAAFLHKMAQQTASNLAPKKANIGSSISQRIKALEKLSSSSVTAAVPEAALRPERPASTFFAVRKGTLREPSRSPSVIDRASILQDDKTPPRPESQESSVDFPRLSARDRSGSMASRLSMFEGGSLPRGRPETIQVKARIIRDPMQPFPRMPELRPDSMELGAFDLKQSPLVVDHRRATTAPHPSSENSSTSFLRGRTGATDLPNRRESIQERRMSKEKRRSQSQDRMSSSDKDETDSRTQRRRSSLSIVRDFIKERRGSLLSGRSPSTDNLHLGSANINGSTYSLTSPGSIFSPTKSSSRPPSVHTTAGLSRRLSISSRRSSMSKDRDANSPPLATSLSPSLMTESGSGDDSKSTTSEFGHKKSGSGSKSRTTRFMRRLSSSFSNNRKAATPNTISPTVAEEDELHNPVPPSRGSTTAAQATIVSFMGDVNVQFPDNLLWKRRTMCLDSQGFLILSTGASLIGERSAGAIKRYHLSDFRMPYIPEMELQELPNSVCLDFIDGSGLQLACEDRAGQMHVLQTLQEAHQTHTSFGQ